MQLNKKRTINGALALATCSLLGIQPVQAAAESSPTEGKDWKIDTAILSYSEKDRVDATEANIRAQKNFGEERFLNINFVADTLSGASPNGAAPTDSPQTFTSPSGKETYTADAGEIPLDDTFRDTRLQLGLSWDAPLSRVSRYNIGTNISTEHDYTSLSLSGGYSHDFNKKNTTLTIGAAYAADSISPEGDIPTPKSSYALESRDADSESKDVFDLVFGITQVINARTLMQFNIGLSDASGYQNDPYKIVSVVDNNGRPVDYLYESRPDARTKTFFYWDTKYHTPWEDTIDLAYRYMTDDWGVDSHTVDLHYRWNISNNFYAEPHFRFYQQTAADFYRHSVLQSEALATDDEPVSADYRLAEFDTTTVGLKLGYLLSADSELNLRLENYQQQGEAKPADAVGVQRNYDMYPDLDASILQIGYSVKF